MRKTIILSFMLLCIFLWGCSNQTETSQTEISFQTEENVQDSTSEQIDSSNQVQIPHNSDIQRNKTSEQSQQETSHETTTLETPFWHTIQLKDVKSGETYTIRELNTKPILLETFAVWCPKCTQQQKEIKKFHKEVGDSVISIGLNVDPNEDENVVLQHIQTNDFDWRYSVSPPELTKALINEFGRTIVSAPSVPMILVCENGGSHLLNRGFKSTKELKLVVRERCKYEV